MNISRVSKKKMVTAEVEICIKNKYLDLKKCLKANPKEKCVHGFLRNSLRHSKRPIHSADGLEAAVSGTRSEYELRNYKILPIVD